VIPKHRHPRLVSPTGSSVAPEGLGWSSLLGMGVATAAILIVGLGLGWLVDSLAHTSPIFLLIGLAVGIFAAGSFVVMKFRTYLNTSDTNSPIPPKND
jgi:O-antigen/teichoic acid export membrane protein